jgi:AraC family transcriptional regulator
MPEPLLRRFILAQGADWTVSDCVCSAGPNDRTYQEVHQDFAVALVTEGTFQYRNPDGDAVLYPGSYLLGNATACFECGHSHSIGDRCIALHASPQLFDEIAASAAGSSRFEFSQPMLPASSRLTRIGMALQSLSSPIASPVLEESVCGLLEAVIGALRTHTPTVARLAAADVRRLSTVLQYINRHAAATQNLAELAALARMSKYHFLRCFRRATGTTPYQYVLAIRLRRAATALARTRLPISTIALNEGFNDLSSFNRYFRRMLNMTPNQYRSSFRLPRLG